MKSQGFSLSDYQRGVFTTPDLKGSSNMSACQCCLTRKSFYLICLFSWFQYSENSRNKISKTKCELDSFYMKPTTWMYFAENSGCGKIP